jgi:prefoldin subunit 5
MFAKTPRLDHTTSGVGIGLSEKVRTEVLEKKVQELERALKEADGEMAEVVGRMNAAQIEVAELQSDRYVAKDSRR